MIDSRIDTSGESHNVPEQVRRVIEQNASGATRFAVRRDSFAEESAFFAALDLFLGDLVRLERNRKE